jgi:hypothetical protein
MEVLKPTIMISNLKMTESEKFQEDLRIQEMHVILYVAAALHPET